MKCSESPGPCDIRAMAQKVKLPLDSCCPVAPGTLAVSCPPPMRFALNTSGTIPGLTRNLTRLLMKGRALNPAEISQLDTEYMLPDDIRHTRRLRNALQALAEERDKAAAKPDCRLDLSDPESVTDPNSWQSLLKEVIASTREARESVDSLRTDLAALKSELRTARDHLACLETEIARDPLIGPLNR